MVRILTAGELRPKPRKQKGAVSIPVFVGPLPCNHNLNVNDRDEFLELVAEAPADTQGRRS